MSDQRHSGWVAVISSVAVRQPPMRVNLRWRSGDRAGRARLSETAGSPASHPPSRPNAFASRDGSRPNRVQLRPQSCGLGETRPTCAVARSYQKSCVSSVSDTTLSWRAWAAAGSQYVSLSGTTSEFIRSCSVGAAAVAIFYHGTRRVARNQPEQMFETRPHFVEDP